MLNRVIIVGRIMEFNNEDNKLIIKISCPRTYKNEEGNYDTDIIPIVTYNNISGNILEYCNKNDLIGVKGRVINCDNNISIVADKVTFLSNKKED